ncbi:hypothetical protein PoB_000678900 [Plakobranchus ocellatus]|uniref:Uncharacterized protein n=1 Tax=Plakobranchus ocellatus TaxID=259542 RepID=A0AAV3YDF2_9GAST|nr:hypothetical protein PoB_000678900 [Plakobranchus ocellatus]
MIGLNYVSNIVVPTQMGVKIHFMYLLVSNIVLPTQMGVKTKFHVLAGLKYCATYTDGCKDEISCTCWSQLILFFDFYLYRASVKMTLLDDISNIVLAARSDCEDKSTD